MNQGCGSGSCGCGGSGGSAATAQAPVTGRGQPEPLTFDAPADGAAAVPDASINGVPLHAPGQRPDDERLRQLACSELLRQAAQQAGLLAADDPVGTDGAQSEPATAAIEQLLEQQLQVPEPSQEACRRHHAAHAALYSSGEKVLARHILFAVTPGVDVAALRQRAERVLLDVRCHGDDRAAADAVFAQAAAQWSNCPSAAQGGDLGWLARADCAPEFARELFGLKDMGVLPRLVHSRFGLHVVQVQGREPGTPHAFEQVQEAVRLRLQQQSWATALRQYLLILAGQARMVGVPLEAQESPLVQ